MYIQKNMDPAWIFSTCHVTHQFIVLEEKERRQNLEQTERRVTTDVCSLRGRKEILKNMGYFHKVCVEKIS